MLCVCGYWAGDEIYLWLYFYFLFLIKYICGVLLNSKTDLCIFYSERRIDKRSSFVLCCSIYLIIRLFRINKYYVCMLCVCVGARMRFCKKISIFSVNQRMKSSEHTIKIVWLRSNINLYILYELYELMWYS